MRRPVADPNPATSRNKNSNKGRDPKGSLEEEKLGWVLKNGYGN